MKNSALKAMLQGAATVFDIAGSSMRTSPLRDYQTLSTVFAARSKGRKFPLDTPTELLEAMMGKDNSESESEPDGEAGLPQRGVTRPFRPLLPLPSPEALAAYDRLVPGGAEIFVLLMEKQVIHHMRTEELEIEHRILETEHRIKKEETLLSFRFRSEEASYRLAHRGQSIAAVLVTLFGIMAGLLGYYDHDWLAGSIALTTITTLAAIFVLGKMPHSTPKNEPP